MRIREASPADAAELARLRFEFRVSRGTAVESEPEFVERCTRWLESELSQEDGWRCWVLEDTGGIVGHCWLNVIRKIPNPVDERELHAYVSNLFVREEHRNRGEGDRLLRTALDWCRDHEVDSVILWPTSASRSLYLRRGFAPPESLLELRLAT